jgi:hypothetical protein
MLLDLRLRQCSPRISRPAIAAVAVGLYLLCPLAASAHGKTRLESGVSTAGPLQESNADPATESGAETPSRERHARHQDQTVTGCDVDLEATPPVVTAGEPFALAGTLSCPEIASASGQTVTLFQKAAHIPGFSIAATTTTDANGAFQFSLPGPEVNSMFYVRSGDANSSRTRVEAAGPQVVIDAPIAGMQLFVGTDRAASDSEIQSSAVTFTGTFSPAEAGATIALQREYSPGRWHRIAVGEGEGEGKYSIVHTFFRPGEANIRVVVSFHGLYATSISTPVTYQILRGHRHG